MRRAVGADILQSAAAGEDRGALWRDGVVHRAPRPWARCSALMSGPMSVPAYGGAPRAGLPAACTRAGTNRSHINTSRWT